MLSRLCVLRGRYSIWIWRHSPAHYLWGVYDVLLWRGPSSHCCVRLPLALRYPSECVLRIEVISNSQTFLWRASLFKSWISNLISDWPWASLHSHVLFGWCDLSVNIWTAIGCLFGWRRHAVNINGHIGDPWVVGWTALKLHVSLVVASTWALLQVQALCVRGHVCATCFLHIFLMLTLQGSTIGCDKNHRASKNTSV